MKYIFLLLSYNINLDKRERQWIDFVLFSFLEVKLHQQALPFKMFEYFNNFRGIRTLSLFHGRIVLVFSKRNLATLDRGA